MTFSELLPHGIATTADLRSAGMRDAAIRTLVRNGGLVRIREGVVALPGCDEAVVEAARIGGRLAGASAARVHGFWTPPRPRLVVEAPRGKHVVFGDWRILRGAPGRARYGVSSTRDVIGQVLTSEPLPFAIAVVDSILRRSPMTRFDVEEAVAHLPPHVRALLRFVDERAESGTESVVRVILALAGIRTELQVRAPFTDLDRLDLVIGDRLVLECDSREHHSSPADLDRDCARDLALTALGFHVLRIRYRAAMFDPDGVLAAVRGVLDAGLHLDRSAPSRRATP